MIGDEEQDLLRLGEEVARFTDADLGMDIGMGMREEDEEDEHMQGMGDDDDQGSEGEEEDEDEEVDDEDAITDDEAVFEVCPLMVAAQGSLPFVSECTVQQIFLEKVDCQAFATGHFPTEPCQKDGDSTVAAERWGIA